MKKVLKPKDLKEEVLGSPIPKWIHEKSSIEPYEEQEPQLGPAKTESLREKRRTSTKSSPDSRQRSNERNCNSNTRVAAAKTTNTSKRVTA